MRNNRLLPYETIVQATSGEPEAAVILQYSSHRFRLPAGGLDDCFIGEKPIISHMPFPPFPLGAAVGLFGYGSPLCCGCARTVCQFRAVEYA